EVSEQVALVTSAGQALKPHWTRALAPARSSTAEAKPSQSGSLAGTSQAGRLWFAFAQSGQLSLTSGRPSASASQALPMQTLSLALAIKPPPELVKLPVQSYEPAVEGFVTTALLWGEERPRTVITNVWGPHMVWNALKLVRSAPMSNGSDGAWSTTVIKFHQPAIWPVHWATGASGPPPVGESVRLNGP